ncbi:YlzJ-like family protein [Siminovitchia sediminis]|uniref:YlzJ-like family protein n=1 Tax=Siminovitchia sediminis TaxID=1274353 RepID=A0ABW4KF26_9BACI
MIIHSIVPPEHIFPVDDAAFSNRTHCLWNNIPLLVEQSGQSCKVVRIISSNPSDYLRTEIQPGTNLHINDIQFN